MDPGEITTSATNLTRLHQEQAGARPGPSSPGWPAILLPGSDARRFSPRVQLLLRSLSAITRLIPIGDVYLIREFLFRGSEVFHEYKFDFVFRTWRLNLRWSAAAFPERFTKHMLFQGSYQEDVLLWIKYFCRRGDIVYDVGAFHGLMSIVASKAVGPKGRVIAFEPNARSSAYMQYHLRLNNCRNVTVEPIGLMDREGELPFYVPRSVSSWNASFTRDFADSRHEVEPFRIPCSTLDGYVRESGLVPKLIKIDTEGTDFAVVRGGRQTIERYRPALIVEFNPISAERAATSISELVSYLGGLGYEFLTIPQDNWGRFRVSNRAPFRQEILHAGELANVLCVPKAAR